MLISAVNVSEGRDAEVLAALADAPGHALLDLHTDAFHHRAVVTVVGEAAVRAVATVALEGIDLVGHAGVHPRLGALDVVPFAPGPGSSLAEAVAAREATIAWLGHQGVPAYRYGEGAPSLPEVRRRAFVDLAPTAGPVEPTPRTGATAVGARPPLVAYNIVLAKADLALAKAIAKAVRSPSIRALGLAVGDQVQVSMNLVDPLTVGPADAYDEVARHAAVAGAELVGLVPAAVLGRIDPARWAELDLSDDRTIEARLRRRP